MARAGDQIENPLTGERLTFRLTAAETDGQLLELDSLWTRPGHRVLEHIHPSMQERWEVISGTARFRIGDEEIVAAVGESVTAPAGVSHLAWNPGDEVVHVRIQLRPALRWETFIERMFALTQDAHAEGQPAPDQSAMVELLREFSPEIVLT